MKHISELLVPQMRQLDEWKRRGAARTFPISPEKGFGEWSALNTIAGDTVHAYHVTLPKKAIVVKEDRHVLRITYPPMHQLRRA